ncbi:MAG: AIR synthase related protein [Trueperella sp.]|nr:AIR synthase related protein [Trueperella sp.]
MTEDVLISRILPLLPQARGVTVPSGDDSAVLKMRGETTVSIDMLIEGHHFTREWFTGYDVGYRAAMQNLADAVAMGARPVSLVVGMSLPADLEVSWVEDVCRGFAAANSELGVGVDGGDFVGGEKIAISVTVLGDMEGRLPVLRSGARPGDQVIHSGKMGYGAAGGELLQAGYGNDGALRSQALAAGASGAVNAETAVDISDPVTAALISAAQNASAADAAAPAQWQHPEANKPNTQFAELIAHFLRPQPPLVTALQAASDMQLHAMMDVSDGLVRDGRRMAKAAQVWIDLDKRALDAKLGPLAAAAGRLGANRRDWLLTGGEDHGFLATIGADDPVPAGFTRIGTVRGVNQSGRLTIAGKETAGLGGWDHFQS